MTPLYLPGETLYIAGHYKSTGRPVVVIGTFVRMQGSKVVVHENPGDVDRFAVSYPVERVFKTQAGATFLGLMEYGA